MAEWHCEIMGNVIGPLTPAELLEKVRTGEVTFDTKVRKGDSQWVAANEVGDLFDRAVAVVKKQVCPYCRAEIGQPPLQCSGCDRYITRAVLIAEGERDLKNWEQSSVKKQRKILGPNGFVSRFFRALRNNGGKPPTQ